MTKCGNEQRITFEEETKPIISIKEPKALLYLWPEQESIIRTFRERCTAYCYQGSVLDPNTGCQVDRVLHPISKEKAIQYVRDNMYETGCECGLECVGTPSACCLSNELINKKGPSVIGSTYFEMMKLAIIERSEIKTKTNVQQP